MRELPEVHLIVLLLELAHLLDFVQVNDEAGVEVVQVLDALTAENRRVFAAVKVLDPLLVFLTHVHSAISLVGLLVRVCIRVSLKALLEIDRG
jgi:hypothetical protein